MSIVYLNGEFMPLEEAKVPVLDRGFTFGDGVYEVLPVYQQHIFRFSEHIDRLNNSLAGIYLDNPLTRDEWRDILETLVARNVAGDQSIYLQITRGVSERDHAIGIAGKPTVFAMSKPLQRQDFSGGISAITAEDIRWSLCRIKAITLLPSIILRHQASLAGAREVILLRNDIVTEGAASNVFIIKNDVVMTPPKDDKILPGITRDLVVELLNNAGIICHEKPVSRNELEQAGEIWITSSTWEIVPVVKLDDNPVGDGKPGSVWKRATEIYQQFKQNASSPQQ